MNNFKSFMMPVLVAFLALSACAKKDSDFAARYAKNGAGATAKDAGKAADAAAQASNYGLQSADIVLVQRSSNRQITAQILINNQQTAVTTSHNGTEVQQGTNSIAGFTVQYHAMCADSYCDVFYAAMEVYKNGQLIIQEGLRINFNDYDKSVYQLFKPSEARIFYQSSSSFQSNMSNPGTIVGYLNSYVEPSDDAALGFN